MDGTAFNRLEERIEALLNRMVALKAENHQLSEQLRQSERKVAELTQLNASFEQERQEVRQRVEGLVERLESHSGEEGTLWDQQAGAAGETGGQ